LYYRMSLKRGLMLCPFSPSDVNLNRTIEVRVHDP